jgi:hypothetical protein
VKVLGIEMPSGPPEPRETDEGDRSTWSQIDVVELRNLEHPDSLPPGASVDDVQSYQIATVARAQAAIGESLREHREYTRQTLAALQARLDLVEMATVGASDRAGRAGKRSSLALALIALAPAVLPEILRMLS